MIKTVKGAKAGQEKPRKPSIAKDSVASTSTVKILYLLGEGEMQGLVNGANSIFLDGTPLVDDAGNSNFEGVTWDFRAGTNEQEYIKGFPDVSNETPIGVELRSSQPWIKAFNDTQLSAVRVRFKWNRLSETNGENGDVKGYKIDYAIDLQTDGSVYKEVLKTKIEDKTSAGYERTHRIDLPKATSGWQIRVRRITPNSTSDLIQDTMIVDAVAEVIDVKLAYPNTALLGVQYNAETFGSIAKMAAHMRGSIIQVPSNYNPVARTYTGVWNGTFKDAYSNNPAWCYYYLCTQWRFGLGEKIDTTMIDKWSIYQLGQFCDQQVSDGQGGLEPRFTCNVYLQKQVDAYEALSNLAGIFRAMSYWNGERIVLDADLPQDPVYTFSRANVVEGNFEYSGTRQRDRHTLAKVAWDNPSNAYQTEYEYIRDEKAMAKFGVKVLDLSAFGCTSQAQAQRAGLWALKTEQLETRQVAFSVGLDGFIPQIGNIVNVSDELFAGRANGGRVSTVNGRVITLDRELAAGTQGVLIVNGADGKSERRNITAVSGKTITVAAAFSSAESENVWAVETPDLKLMRFRVMQITQNDDNTFSIVGIQHEPQKYDAIDFGTDVKPTDITIVNPETVDAPTSVTITSRHRVAQGQTVTTLVIAWSQVKGAVAYDVEWRKDDGTWIKLPRTGNVSVEVDGVYSGSYMARVRAVSAFEVQSNATTSSLTTVQGKVGLPPTIVGLKATGILFGMELSWGFQSGSGDAAFTEIQTASAPNVNVALLGQFSYPTNAHTITGLQGNLSQSYRARLTDKLGFTSEWSAWVTATTDASADKILDLLDGEIKESHLYNELSTKIDKVNQIEPIKNALGDATKPDSVLGQLQTAKDRFGDDQKLLNSVEQAIKAKSSAEFKSFKDLVDEDGRMGGIIERDLGKDQNGAVFGKLSGVFAQIGSGRMAGDTDRWAGDDSFFAGSWSIQSAIIENDVATAQRIDGVASQVNNNQAQILDVATTTASKNEVTANRLTSLSGQLIGGYDGDDISKITSGLLFDEMSLRLTEDNALAERISMLSVGVGESFDPFNIWHFDKNTDGWTGGVYDAGGYLNARTTAIKSPALTINTVDDDGLPISEQIDTKRYHHLKARVIKVGTPTWSGLVTWTGSSKTIAEPVWTADNETVVNIDLAWSGAIADFSIKVAATADNLNYYKVDWITVGSPSPAASSAQLARVERVSASRYQSAAQEILTLNSKVDGDPDTGIKSLAQIRSELSTTSSLASSTASKYDILTAEYQGGDLKTFYADVLGTSNSIASNLGAVSNKVDGVFAQVNPRLAGDTDRWAGDDNPVNAVGSWSLQSAIIEGDNFLASRVDTVAAQVGGNSATITTEREARIQGDLAITSQLEQLSSVVGGNSGVIKDLDVAISTPEIGIAARISQLQSTTNTISDEYKKKADIVFSNSQPNTDKQNARTLWVDTTNGKNVFKRWNGIKWDIATDQTAVDIANDLKTNLASYVEQSGAFTNQFGSISGKITTVEGIVDGQKSSIEVVNALGGAEQLRAAIAKARLDKDVSGLGAKTTAIDELLTDYYAQQTELNGKIQSTTNPALKAEYQAQRQALSDAISELTAEKADITNQVQQLEDEIAELDSLVETESEVKKQYFVKFDSGNRAAGFGIMENADATIDFAILADKFYIAPPNGTGKGTAPFVVLTGASNTLDGVTGIPAGTYIRSAYIHKASIDTAQIKDAAIKTAQIDNLAVTTGKIDNLAVTTAKIDNLAVKSAQIDNLAVTTGKIANLAVDTLQIAGFAVTVPLSSYTEASIGISGNNYTTVQSMVIPNIQGSKSITVSAAYSQYPTSGASTASLFMQVTLNEVIVIAAMEVNRTETRNAGVASFSLLLGDAQYGTLEFKFSQIGALGATNISHRYINMMLTKR